jgi:hypothetical protein
MIKRAAPFLQVGLQLPHAAVDQQLLLSRNLIHDVEMPESFCLLVEETDLFLVRAIVLL